MKYFVGTCLIVAASVVGFVLPSAADDTTTANELPKRPTYVENFNGTDRTTMLGGQLEFIKTSGPWIKTISNGKLLFENRLNPQVLHYEDIKWVRYDGESSLSSTQSARLAVTVESSNEGRAGAGILVGSGKLGKYLVFAVDQNGRFHVVEKDRGKTRIAYSGVSKSIRTDHANRLTFDHTGGVVTFFANGSELIKMPFKSRNGTGIGLAAFGLGIFTFDDVEITK